MKKIILIASIIVVVCQAKAQTVYFFNKTVDHAATKDSARWAKTDPAKGVIKITAGLITVSPVGTSSKIMVILKPGKWEAYDEGYQLREFTVAEITGPKSMIVYSVLVLRNSRKQISDITLKLNGQQVSYQIIPYKPGEYGYKLQHHLKTD